MNPDDRGGDDSLRALPDESTATQVGVGTQLGPYRIEGPLGSGGMGQVFRARDTRLGRAVAIKISHAKFSDRFEREARAISALNHPHICTLYDVGPNYLVMELVEGTPLKGPLPPDQALQYAGQICDALDAAHRKGITHRDLKPANILVAKQGVKILDFGLAHMALEPGDPTLTQAGAVMGTPAYMAPEQWEGKQADARSDIYAFGCVLYEMLTGKRPSQNWPGLETQPASLASVVRTCVQKDPDDRWQSASDIKRALALPTGAPEPPKQPRQRWLWIAGAIAILVVGAAGGGAIARFLQPAAEAHAMRFQLNPPAGGQFIFGLGITPGGIALSPDGETVAFVTSAGGKTGLWLQSIDGVGAHLLPGTEGAAYPFWKPDSRSIAFFQNGKLQRIDLPGGAPLTICECAQLFLGSGAWSNDGYILFATDAGLSQVSDSGGTPSHLSALSSSAFLPQILPGGRVLYFSQGGPGGAGIFVGSLAKPAESVHLLTTASSGLYAPGGDGKHYLLWLRGSTLLGQEMDLESLKLVGELHTIADPVGNVNGLPNVSVSANGLMMYGASNALSQFTRFDRGGNRLGTAGEPGDYNSFRLSADGRRAVFSRNHPEGADLWLLDTERGVSSPFTSNSGVATYPVFGPAEGGMIVFSMGVPLSLFLKPSTGIGREQPLIPSGSPLELTTDWSRGGGLLYFEVGVNTGEDIWTLPVTSDGKRIPGAEPRYYVHSKFREFDARFSPEPNPRWVTYMSDKSGRLETYIDSFPNPGHEVQVSTEGGLYPEWSDAGNELFYVSPDYRLMAVKLKITAGSLEPSPAQALFKLPASVSTWSPYEVYPGGQRFLVRAKPEQEGSQPLTVIVNWPALLKSQ